MGIAELAVVTFKLRSSRIFSQTPPNIPSLIEDTSSGLLDGRKVLFRWLNLSKIHTSSAGEADLDLMVICSY